MTTDVYAERKRLTFAQAEGAAALPSQLQPKEISSQLQALLWEVVYSSLQKSIEYPPLGGPSYFIPPWNSILYDKHINQDHGMADEFRKHAENLIYNIKSIFLSRNYIKIFEFLQFALRHPRCPSCFSEGIDDALKKSRAAYRILDKNTIIPISSEAERATLEKAFADLEVIEFQGARSHLREAGVQLTAGRYADSIRESIHTVESVARTLAPCGSFSKALGTLEKKFTIHGGLRAGFLSIYGYTSDEQGLRHPLIDDPQANVDETDALFMIGACASFVSYMINKAHSAGILTTAPTGRS